MLKKIFKKKGFLIDKISEDSFYENLLLGLPSLLKSSPFVAQIQLERYPPASAPELKLWETANFISLPEDLCNFYLSTNGFGFSYKFQYDKNGEESSHVMAGIEIHSLQNLTAIAPPDTMYLTENGVKVLAPHSKIFALAPAFDENCVVLAQFDTTKPPSIWFYYKMKNFYFLCDTIVVYLRMAVAHLGVPGWQLSVLKANMPEYSVEMLQILAPGRLQNREFQSKCVLNQLDKSIFEISSEDCEGGGDKRSETKKTHRNKTKK